MKRMRKYLAVYDDGHDFGEFEYYSGHRANSKANLEDAIKEYKRVYGFRRAQRIEIVSTQRWEVY